MQIIAQDELAERDSVFNFPGPEVGISEHPAEVDLNCQGRTTGPAAGGLRLLVDRNSCLQDAVGGCTAKMACCRCGAAAVVRSDRQPVWVCKKCKLQMLSR